MFKKLIFVFFVFICKFLFAQEKYFIENNKYDTLIRTGRYNYKDIYVLNPITIKGKDTLWAAQKVFVNDSIILTKRQLHKTVFIIPLTKLSLKKTIK